MSGSIWGRRGLLLAGAPLLVALALLALSWAGGGTGGMTELEARLSATLSDMEGAGQVRAMVLTDADQPTGQAAQGEVTGVIIVASGAYDIGVQLRLQRAVMTLFALPAEQVEVFSGREGSAE